MIHARNQNVSSGVDLSHPKKMLDALGANALKSFSQNFLTSPHWAEKLTGEVLNSGANAIWEIGPGLGALTDLLVAKATVPLKVFEIDRKLAARLRETYPQLELVEGDFLKTAPAALPPESTPVAVLSNLPYHLSSAIVFRIVDWGSQVKVAVLTFQREFAERMKAKVGDDAYNGLSVNVQYHFEVESLGILPKGAFYPEPGVQSEALRLTPRQVDFQIAAQFRALVRQAFTRPRRKLSGNLKGAFPEALLQKAYASAAIDPNRRPETLSLDEFRLLFAELNPPNNP